MRIVYDAQADALSLVFRETEPQKSYELSPGLIVSLDSGGDAVAVEVLHARARLGRDGIGLIKIDLHQL